ncbi:tubulin binding cofactor A [Cristinia sonorae]|uniref:Tubulin-specific chaperone A n=1 Tax=Cristinia sonorae TaxID=1940300 RepID=A0A8K0XMS7_9AGAR|nr:tubulin binding cofactor A [Cristinia sonorae]
MSDVEVLRRQLKIKSGVAKRLFKEHQSYEKEAEDQQIKLDKLIAEQGEEWYIKNARNMLEESKKLIKDTSDRFGNAVQDLRDTILVAKQKEELAEDEELLKAEEALETVSV